MQHSSHHLDSKVRSGHWHVLGTTRTGACGPKTLQKMYWTVNNCQCHSRTVRSLSNEFINLQIFSTSAPLEIVAMNILIPFSGKPRSNAQVLTIAEMYIDIIKAILPTRTTPHKKAVRFRHEETFLYKNWCHQSSDDSKQFEIWVFDVECRADCNLKMISQLKNDIESTVTYVRGYDTDGPHNYDIRVKSVQGTYPCKLYHKSHAQFQKKDSMMHWTSRKYSSQRTIAYERPDRQLTTTSFKLTNSFVCTSFSSVTNL